MFTVENEIQKTKRFLDVLIKRDNKRLAYIANRWTTAHALTKILVIQSHTNMHILT